MGGSRVITEPGFEVDALPFGVVLVDREGTIKAFSAFDHATVNVAHERMIGQNFFKDVAPYADVSRFHERFREFSATPATSVEPFEFVFPRASGERRVTILFVRDEKIDDRVSIILMRNGALA